VKLSPSTRGCHQEDVDARAAGSGPPRYDGWYPNLFYNRDECSEWSPIVADVHTDRNRGVVWRLLGDAMLGAIAIDNDKDRMATWVRCTRTTSSVSPSIGG